jgi:hypothetical protein
VKYCNGCAQTLNLSEFSLITRRGKKVKRSRCRLCWNKSMREWRKKNRQHFLESKREGWPKQYLWSLLKKAINWGYDKEEFVKWLAAHDGKCDICNCRPKEGFHLHLDHCHKTNNVRGLLCRKCNLAIGLLQDNSKLLQAAIEYLKKKR